MNNISTLSMVLSALLVVPLITLNVIKDDCYITVISTQPWTLYQSGNCKNWWKLYSGKPMYSNSIQIIQFIDKGWASWARLSFYKVVPDQTSNLR